MYLTRRRWTILFALRAQASSSLLLPKQHSLTHNDSLNHKRSAIFLVVVCWLRAKLTTRKRLKIRITLTAVKACNRYDEKISLQFNLPFKAWIKTIICVRPFIFRGSLVWQFDLHILFRLLSQLNKMPKSTRCVGDNQLRKLRNRKRARIKSQDILQKRFSEIWA